MQQEYVTDFYVGPRLTCYLLSHFIVRRRCVGLTGQLGVHK